MCERANKIILLSLFYFISSSYITWKDYSKTLIDAALPKGLLDYFDFHAYGGDATPQVS